MFKRRRSGSDASNAFWTEPPFPDRDPAVVYQYGLASVGRQDGPAMMRTGWRIQELTGRVDLHQSADLLRDGFKLWCDEPSTTEAAVAAFLESLLAVLADDPRQPEDPWSRPPSEVEPIAAHYSLRCWTASELAERGLGDPAALYSAIERSSIHFVPPRSMAWARAYAAEHGLREPWT